jgi:hypothetical protein
MEKWFLSLHDPAYNPFWAADIGDDPPLNPNDPKIDIILHQFSGRRGFEMTDIAIMSADRILYSGKMENGQIRATIDQEIGMLSDWKAPLTIR